MAMAMSHTQTRAVNALPALIRFFHSNATGGKPVGESLNGARWAFAFCRPGR